MTGLGSEFWPTAFGAALGVVAGVLIQYILEIIVQKNRYRSFLRNAKLEFLYNYSLINEMLSEVSVMRATSQPDTLSKYFGYFANGAAFWIATNKLITEGNGYTIFNALEINMIQKSQRFLSSGTEKWIFENINENKSNNDVSKMLSLAAHIEKQCKDTLLALDMIINH